MLLAWTAGTGCTALREIPREEYTERVPRRAIKVVTREGLSYDLDAAQVRADTLVGYRRRDIEGPVDEFDTLQLPLDDVATISARRIDWYRTGLAGGLSMAALVVVAIGRHNAGAAAAPASDCRKGECP
jgi:hypothetical protein